MYVQLFIAITIHVKDQLDHQVPDMNLDVGIRCDAAQFGQPHQCCLIGRIAPTIEDVLVDEVECCVVSKFHVITSVNVM